MQTRASSTRTLYLAFSLNQLKYQCSHLQSPFFFYIGSIQRISPLSNSNIHDDYVSLWISITMPFNNWRSCLHFPQEVFTFSLGNGFFPVSALSILNSGKQEDFLIQLHTVISLRNTITTVHQFQRRTSAL